MCIRDRGEGVGVGFGESMDGVSADMTAAMGGAGQLTAAEAVRAVNDGTGVRRNSRDPEVWQFNDDLKQPGSEMLSKTYGISGERVSQQLADVAGKLVADYWDNNGGDIRAIAGNKPLLPPIFPANRSYPRQPVLRFQSTICNSPAGQTVHHFIHQT